VATPRLPPLPDRLAFFTHPSRDILIYLESAAVPRNHPMVVQTLLRPPTLILSYQ